MSFSECSSDGVTLYLVLVYCILRCRDAQIKNKKMIRRSLTRLGHQLIKEPLGNEENTLSRGRRTYHHLATELTIMSAVSAAGVLMAACAIYGCGGRRHSTVDASGKFKRI